MQIAFDNPQVIEFTLKKIHEIEHANGTTKETFFPWLISSGLNVQEKPAKSIQQIVCEHYKVEVKEAFEGNPPEQSECRHVCAYFYLLLFHHKHGALKTEKTSGDVAKILGTSRQNIEKSNTTIKGRVDVEPRFREKIESIEKSILNFYNDNLLNYENS